MLISAVIYLTMIPGNIREEKCTSAGFNIILFIISAMLMIYHLMSLAN